MENDQNALLERKNSPVGSGQAIIMVCMVFSKAEHFADFTKSVFSRSRPTQRRANVPSLFGDRAGVYDGA